MTEEQFKQRTKQYGLRIIRLVESLPRGRTASIIGRQLLRAGNFRGRELSGGMSGKVGSRYAGEACYR